MKNWDESYNYTYNEIVKMLERFENSDDTTFGISTEHTSADNIVDIINWCKTKGYWVVENPYCESIRVAKKPKMTPQSITQWTEAIKTNSDLHGLNSKPRNEMDFINILNKDISNIHYEFDNTAQPNKIYYTGTDGKPEGVPAKLAEILYQVLDMAAHYDIDLQKALRLVYSYNLKQPYLYNPKFKRNTKGE